MGLRIFGYALIVCGVALGLFAYSALSDVDGRAQFMAQMGTALEQQIDPQQWASRWRETTLEFAILAVGALIAGVGFLTRARLGWAALAITMVATAVSIVVMRARGARQYTFESVAR